MLLAQFKIFSFLVSSVFIFGCDATTETYVKSKRSTRFGEPSPSKIDSGTNQDDDATGITTGSETTESEPSTNEPNMISASGIPNSQSEAVGSGSDLDIVLEPKPLTPKSTDPAVAGAVLPDEMTREESMALPLRFPISEQCKEASQNVENGLSRRLSKSQLIHTLSLKLGFDAKAMMQDFPEDQRLDQYLSTKKGLTVASSHVEFLWLNTSKMIEAIPNLNLFLSAYSDCQEMQENCTRSLINQLSLHLSSKALEPDEVSIYMKLATKVTENAGTFDTFGTLFLRAYLQSPTFLYLLESQTEQVRWLSPEEMAKKLSYLLWDGPADQELINQITTVGVANDLTPIIKQMFESPKFETGIRSFVRDWIELDNLESTISRDPELFPDFNQEIVESAKEETYQLFIDHAKAPSKPFRAIFNANQSTLSPELAEFYGIETAGTFDLPEESLRGGLLTHASINMLTSGPTEPSIISRGLFVNRKLLCKEIPVPPANLRIAFPSNLPENASRRQKIEEIEKSPSCAGCHLTIDPPGLAMDIFDATGALALQDAFGNALSSNGVHRSGGEQKAYQNVLEYGDILADDKEANACLVESVVRYSLGRVLSEMDKCTIEQIRGKWSSGSGSYQDLLLAITTSQMFRRVESR